MNVASRCGYTDSNYKQLQVLHEKYAKDGLQIFAAPSNEFGGTYVLGGREGTGG